MKALLLFDIDGTLIDTEGAGLASLEKGLFGAFPEFADREFPPLDLGGATDGGVVTFLFQTFGIAEDPVNHQRFYEYYSEALSVSLKSHGEQGKGRILEGVTELLSEIKREAPDSVSAILTGNAEVGAKIKLRHYELNHYFSFGAYGDEHADRNELGPIAMRRAKEKVGRDFAPEEVIVIGDTVKDIECGRACGAKVIAVATGTASKAELKNGRPDALLDDLSDLSATVDTLRNVFSPLGNA